jgi:hypothetical protein
MGKHETVRDAYQFGYPLVTMDMVRKHETNVREPDGAHAPMGQLIKLRSYPPVDDHAAAAPNADTLYTMVWLDVSSEPWVFGIPEMGDRFYIMPMLSSYNEVFFVAGSRATGGKPQEYVVTASGWSGALPEGVTQVESPTALVWILGRVYCSGPEDYAAVHELQDRFSSVPLSAYGTQYTPSPGVVDETVDIETAVRKQVNDLPLEEFFRYLAELLKTNPPKPEDRDRAGAGLRQQQAAEAGAQARSEACAPGAAPHDEGQGARQRLALLDKRRRPVRNGLRAAGTGHHDRARDELRRGCGVPALREGRGRRRVRRRRAPLRHALRAGPDAAGQGVLVADHVRPGLLLRPEPPSTATA